MIKSFLHRLVEHWPWLLLLGLAGLTLAPLLGDYSRKLDFVGQFLIQSTALTVIALVLMLLLRHALPAIGVGLCLALQLAILQPSLLQARASADARGRIEVVFSNVWTQNRRLGDLAERLREIHPDVLVLTEIRGDSAVAFAHSLADAYPYRADCETNWWCDTVVLSRLPILEDRSSDTRPPIIGMAAARVQTDFGPITIAGTHLAQPLPPRRQWVQEQQTEALATMIEGVTDPLLFVGDFNSVPWGRLIRAFTATTGLDVAPGLEGTWPAILPWPLRLPIDQAFTGRGLQLLSREVITLPGADHKALRLEVGPTGS